MLALATLLVALAAAQAVAAALVALGGEVPAVIAKPRLLLADEPTGNLHSDQGAEIVRLRDGWLAK